MSKCLTFLENAAIKNFGMVSQGTLNSICDQLSVKMDISKDKKRFA